MQMLSSSAESVVDEMTAVRCDAFANLRASIMPLEAQSPLNCSYSATELFSILASSTARTLLSMLL